MSNTQKKNVPELRFPGFEGEYSLDIFGNLATNKSDKFNPQNENASIDIELDCIEQNTGRLIKIYNSKEFSSQKNKFNPQNVLYGKLRPYLNKYYFTKKSGVCSSEIWVLKSTKEDKLLNLFLYYFIQTKRYSDVASKSAGSKMPRADWGLIENIRVYFPELCEQQKIGQFFSKLDRQIELEEQKLELLQQQKKGYMQKIFSQELRFKNENGNDYPDWERIKFFDVIDKVIDFRGRTPKKLNMEWSDEGYLALSAVNVKKGYIDFNVEAKYGNLDLYTRWMRGNELYKGQVLFTTEAPMGNVAQVPDNKGYILSQRTIAFNSNEKITDNFLASLLSSENVYNDLLKLCSGATAKGVSQKNLNRLYVTIPHSISEQEEIAEFFRKINQLVELQKYKIEHTKSQKQVFLQKMFI
ncbi:restriction endonuclease subunit S [Staphylococcus aureus]|uniref:restriction endonuclease subunit S n=1 Tax=Staphylococcus aureus TaxID=1280 RepID=UPI0012AF4556|nr:restriction endonuclease subunit S [Staphylococcus aureus]MCC5345913.1 restriction endonuclease subunit S [Staphylococcus aureus]MDT3277215.1 restriction endonuclease subunit S [Staphylococcus aureus]MRX23922.1 restriction endonuclease subunit S [Staphylococcus aureus]HCD0976034.1 restriction endonuclease subunit S [Staphylococcus aureus]HCD0984334.1 restriction endonuclease subunit S [Staphylococcus aureus]